MMLKNNRGLWIMLFLAIVMLIPFLGLTDFNTKGEPREAVVAFTMLDTGNWVLPINNGGDIPYKPPFFHWCIALFSLIPGYVSEYTSRLPSAVALILMVVGGYCFISKRKDESTAFFAALLTLTSFEVHRAGYACRVDMVLTACIVGSMYLMYRWWERGKKSLPWIAILLMSAGTLTKGPIGIILPCLVMGVFMLVQREKLWSTVWRLVLVAVLSLVLPLCWYYAAYQQGGDAFLTLVMEENFGRFMGKMSYESHENPFWYNFITLITGWLPWTLLALISLFFLPWKSFSKSKVMQSIRKADKLQTFLWLAFLIVLVFYCIPKSKRSVYLLPCYPFMAVLLAEYFEWLRGQSRKLIISYLGILMLLCAALTGTFIAVREGWEPSFLFHGKHAAQNMAFLYALRDKPMNILLWALMAMPLYSLLVGTTCLLQKKNLKVLTFVAMSSVIFIFLALDGVIQPAVLNVKADKHLAPVIEKRFDTSRLYSYISIQDMHFFSLNFYLGDKIQQFDKAKPQDGVLMISDEDMPAFVQKEGKGYNFKKVWEVARTVEIHSPVGFYQFTRNN